MSGAYTVICKVFHRLMPAYRSPGWLADTFTNSNDAEDALCRDRSGFLQRVEMGLIPRPIWSRFINFGPTAHIEGFQILFDYLNTAPAGDKLRQQVVNYFNDVRYLQPHLLPPLSTLYSHFMMYARINKARI